MPLMRINYYIYAEDEKAGSGIEKVYKKALAGSIHPHLTEDSEIFFEVGSDGALFRKWKRTTSHHWNDRRRERSQRYARRVGGVGNVYNVLKYHQRSQKQNINIHQSN